MFRLLNRIVLLALAVAFVGSVYLMHQNSLEISRLHADGLRVESRCGHQAVLRALVPPRRRTQIFVDEFGTILQSGSPGF